LYKAGKALVVRKAYAPKDTKLHVHAKQKRRVKGKNQKLK